MAGFLAEGGANHSSKQLPEHNCECCLSAVLHGLDIVAVAARNLRSSGLRFSVRSGVKRGDFLVGERHGKLLTHRVLFPALVMLCLFETKTPSMAGNSYDNVSGNVVHDVMRLALNGQSWRITLQRHDVDALETTFPGSLLFSPPSRSLGVRDWRILRCKLSNAQVKALEDARHRGAEKTRIHRSKHKRLGKQHHSVSIREAMDTRSPLEGRSADLRLSVYDNANSSHATPVHQNSALTYSLSDHPDDRAPSHLSLPTHSPSQVEMIPTSQMKGAGAIKPKGR